MIAFALNNPPSSPFDRENNDRVVPQIEVGDIVRIRTTRIPVPDFEGAVSQADGKSFSIFSTDARVSLADATDDILTFLLSDTDFEVILVTKAEEAVPNHSRKGFVRGERVKALAGDFAGQIMTVVAAHNGFVSVMMDDGQPAGGGAVAFEKLS